MRTPAPLAAGLALALALGSVLALGAASAGADDWTATVTNTGTIYPNSTVYFSGTLPAGSGITSISVGNTSIDPDAACDGSQFTTEWSCSYTPPNDYSNDLGVGVNTIVFVVSTSSEAESNESLEFTVTPYPTPNATLNDPSPVYSDQGTFEFSGTTDTPVLSATVNFSDESSTGCALTESPSSTWACNFTSDSSVPEGDASISLEFAGNPTEIDPLPFTVLPDPPAGAISFLPGGFVVEPLNNADTIDIYSFNGEGWTSQHSWYAGEPNSGAGCQDNDLGVSCEVPPITSDSGSQLAQIWRFDAYRDAENSDELPPSEVDQYFEVPGAPIVTGVSVTSDGRLRLTGSNAQVVTSDGEGSAPASGILLYLDHGTTAAPCLDTDGTTVVPANDDGTWTCETVPLDYGPHYVNVAVQDLGAGDQGDLSVNDGDAVASYIPGGLSVESEAVSATLVAPAPPTGGTTGGSTTPTVITPVWSFDLSGLNLGDVHPGDTFTVTGTGLPPGSTVSFELHSTPVSLGSTVVKPDGTFSLTGIIPADTTAGAHHLIATLSGPGLATTTSDKPLTVAVPASAATTGTATTPSSDAKPAEHSIVGEPGGSPTAPNILTHGLQSIADVVAHPAKIPAALAVGLVLLIFAVLPGHLLNATLAEQYERLARRVPRLRSTPAWLATWRSWLSRAPFVGGLLVTAATALLFCLADPRFGFTLATLRLFLAGAIALFVVVYLSNAIASLIVRRRWSIDVRLSIRPLGLVLTVVGVIVSRLLDFSPGFLIGLVLGLTIVGKSAANFAWRAVLIRSGVVIGLALLAWLGFSLFTVGEAEGSTFGSELFLEVLVAITTEGIVALLVELLPLRLLEGERIYRRSKLAWGALYLVCVVIFIVAVVPWEGNWEALGSSLWSWIAVVVVFGAICTGIYLFFRFFAKEHESEESDEPRELVSISDNE